MPMNILFEIEKKPREGYCKCFQCQKEIEKGEIRFRIGAIGYRQSSNRFYHLSCFFDELETMCLDFAKENKVQLPKKRKFLQGFHLAMFLCGK